MRCGACFLFDGNVRPLRHATVGSRIESWHHMQTPILGPLGRPRSQSRVARMIPNKEAMIHPRATLSEDRVRADPRRRNQVWYANGMIQDACCATHPPRFFLILPP